MALVVAGNQRVTVAPISCSFDQLYPGGAGFPEPDMLATGCVSQPAAEQNIEVIAELFPSQGYGRPFSTDIFVRRTAATDSMEPLYRDLAVKAASSVALVHIARAVTYNSIIYAQNHGFRVIYETQRWNDRTATEPPPIEALENAHPFDPSAATDYLFLASAGSPNYGHVLVDDLPRLKAVEHLRALWPSRRQGVIFPAFGGAVDSVRRDAVATFCGPDVEVRFVEANRSHAIANLFYASPCSFHPTIKNPLAMTYARSTARAAVGNHPDTFKHLFVGRPSHESRQLLNNAALVGQLEARGYRQIHPERMTFLEQLRAFAAADRVVGQMGAAMTNTLFCAQGTDLLYLAPQGWIEPFYWDLSTTLDQRYHVLYGAVSAEDPSPSHLKNCEIDLSDVLRYLDDG